MDEDIKRGLKKAVQQAELSVTRSILRWKYKREGKQVPLDDRLEDETRHIAGQAHEVIARRGKNAWKELKRAYLGEDGKKGAGE